LFRSRIDRQLARLADAAAYFDYPCGLPRLREQLLAAAAGLAPGPHHLRLELTARGTAVLDSERLTRDRRPWRLAWAPEPIDTADPHRWHKTSRRQALEAARAAWPDHDDVVLWNRQGEVTETTRAHLALRLGGRWWTPARDSGLLA